MEKKWNWGVLGCGKIAAQFSRDLQTLPNAVLYAAGSRSADKAREFADQNGFEKAFGNYDELLQDPALDIVYVASPHSHHMEHTLRCLKYGKAVLCEKAFALNADQAERMVHEARQKKVFLMEAFWTKFQPAFMQVEDFISTERVGPIKMMRSDFAFNAPFDPDKRLYNLELGGGSLLDIGIYPVFAALSAFGEPDEITCMTHFSPTGSEESIAILFKYNDGRMASLQSSFAVYADVQSEYWGTKGFIRINRQGVSPTKVEVWEAETKQTQNFLFEYQDVSGYHLEAKHVMDCLDQGLTESPELPLAFSLSLMRTLDRIRKIAGIRFPGIKE